MTTQSRTVRRPVAIAQARAQRRMTAWDDEIFESILATGAVVSVPLMVNVSDAEKRGCTLIREIINLTFRADTMVVAEGSQRVTCGLALSSDDAFAGAALPDAHVAADFPVGGWLWREQIFVRDSAVAHAGQVVSIWRDLRASRKCDRSTVYLTVKNEGDAGTAFNVNVQGMIRLLYKLP